MNNELNMQEYLVTFIENGHNDLNQSHDDLAEKKKNAKKAYLKRFGPAHNKLRFVALIYKKCFCKKEREKVFLYNRSGRGTF